jgi:hypothetical protein
MVSVMVWPLYHRFGLERRLDGPGAGLHVVAKNKIRVLAGNPTQFIS